MSASGLLGVIDRWALFAAVLVSTGAAAFHFLVVGRSADADPDGGAVRRAIDGRAAVLGVVAAWLGCAAALGRFPLQVAELFDDTTPLLPQIEALGLHTTWGTVWIVQLLTALITASAFSMVRRGARGAWAAAAVSSALLAITPAFSGHAIGSERLTVLAVIADAVHVLAASTWVGAMASLFAGLWIAERHDALGGRIASILVKKYSRIALTSAGLVVATGLFASWLHVGSIPGLWQARYGQVLTAKLAAVLVMAIIGLWNWRRGGPGLAGNGVVGPMRRSIRLELVVGAVVLLVTAVLVAVPQPGME